MAYSVQWLVDGPNNSKVEFSQGGRVSSSYKRTYLYRTDAALKPTDAQIVTDLGIYPGSPHPDDANATCHSVQISHGVGPTKCPHFARHVEVEWSTLAPNPNATSTNPTSMRTVWNVRPSLQERYIWQDRHGDMILNAAGQPFDGGIPAMAVMGTAVAQKNFPDGSFNVASVLGFSGYLNSYSYLGADPGTLQVLIEARERYEGSYHFWELTFSFSYDPKGWQPKPINAGFFQRESIGSSTLKRIVNSDIGDTNEPDAQVQEPEPLTEDGLILPIASRPAGCNFIEVDYWPTTDFNAWGL